MSMAKKAKTEHAGPKNSGRKSGFYGLRVVAKNTSRKIRRARDKSEVEKQLKES